MPKVNLGNMKSRAWASNTEVPVPQPIAKYAVVAWSEKARITQSPPVSLCLCYSIPYNIWRCWPVLSKFETSIELQNHSAGWFWQIKCPKVFRHDFNCVEAQTDSGWMRPQEVIGFTWWSAKRVNQSFTTSKKNKSVIIYIYT